MDFAENEFLKEVKNVSDKNYLKIVYKYLKIKIYFKSKILKF